MAAVDYMALCDAVKTTLSAASGCTGYGWFRDRYDLTVGNLPRAVNVAVLWESLDASEFDTGGRTRKVGVALLVAVRGQSFAKVEELLSDAVAAIEYQCQPPTLACPFYGDSHVIDVELSAVRRIAVDGARLSLILTVMNEE